MLTEKDYCDYETCVALRELGYNAPQMLIIDYFGVFEEPQYDENIHLYDAQKWLREEKKIIIEATFSLIYKGQPRFSWRVLYNLTQHKGAYYTLDSVNSKEDYDSFEEALSEGIKEAVKILKEK